MDFRKLGWKKKTSEKNVTTSESSESVATQLARQNDEQATKLEEALKAVTDRDQLLEEASQQLQDIEERNKVLSEKLTAAISEASQKENLVKQHAKVAEEAVSGWEKAEAEALASKQQVESLTKQKIVLEDRISHLDGALKECMRQLRHVKEENEHRLHETILNKNRELDRVKLEFQSKRADLENHVLQVEAENDALSRSLQERNHSLVELNDARAEAEAQINVLQVNIEQYQKENASLSFEIQVLNKSLEIRTEEKNISMKSAEAANKQHLEDIKKITKLEAECQRLRALVKKKLPGPAALAQMRIEADYGKDLAEGRRRKSPSKTSGSFVSSSFGSGFCYTQDQGQNDSSFLTERLLAMEEETKMLKEALAKRNSELQASRSLYSKSQGRIAYLEKQLESFSPNTKQRKTVLDLPSEGPRSHTTSNPPSLASMSEDGNEDEPSCTESWSTASALISGVSQGKKGSSGRVDKSIESGKLDLMNDFEEMERLASLPSAELASSTSTLDVSAEKATENKDRAMFEKNLAEKESELQASVQHCSEISEKLSFLQQELAALQLKNCSNENALASIRAKLDSVLGTYANTDDAQKVLQAVRSAIIDEGIIDTGGSDARKSLQNPSSSSEHHDKGQCTEFSEGLVQKADGSEIKSEGQLNINDTDLEKSFSRVAYLLECISREAQHSKKIPHSKVHDINTNVENFSKTISEFVHGNSKSICLFDGLSSLLSTISEICSCSYSESTDQHNENERPSISADANSNELHNKASQTSALNDMNFEAKVSHLHAEKLALESELQTELNRSKSLEEKLSQVSREKDNLRNELNAIEEQLKQKNDQLNKMETTVEDLQKDLVSVKDSMWRAESQSEALSSRKSELESQLKRIEIEKSGLHEKIESLMWELEQKHRLQEEAETRCSELTEELQRKDEELARIRSLALDNDTKARQEREIASAAEKLAECQRTIDVLGRQLKTLTSPRDSLDLSNYNEKIQTTNVTLMEDTLYPNSRRDSNARSVSKTHGSIGSESEITISNYRKQKKGQRSSRSAIQDGSSSRENSDSYSRRPSSSDTEVSSPAKSPPINTPRKSRIPRSLAGRSLSRSLNMDGKPSSSERSASAIGKFFSRKTGN